MQSRGAMQWRKLTHCRSFDNTTPSTAPTRAVVLDDYANIRGPSLLKETPGLQNHRHSTHVGSTAEFEPCLLDLRPHNDKGESPVGDGAFRKVGEIELFLMQPHEGTHGHQEEIANLDAIKQVVAPYGDALTKLYFRIVHPNFPIVHKKVYLEKYTRNYREYSPPLRSAVYILALNWWSYSSELADLSKPDVAKLERLAFLTINDVIRHRPKLSTVQAGLLLLQCS